jgi:hypothetical protein
MTGGGRSAGRPLVDSVLAPRVPLRWTVGRLGVIAHSGRRRRCSTMAGGARVEPMANQHEEAEAAARYRAHRDSGGFASRGE